jgi:hypothetical protein
MLAPKRVALERPFTSDGGHAFIARVPEGIYERGAEAYVADGIPLRLPAQITKSSGRREPELILCGTATPISQLWTAPVAKRTAVLMNLSGRLAALV